MTGLALTPPMGWNSWNEFGPRINEDLVKEIAQGMVDTGMQAAGYEYVVLDDLWHGGRGQDGRLFEDAQKFPHGMQALGDAIHALGLKFGIYSDAGTKTCGGMPASLGYEEIDAQTFADWGVDYLKYDYCYAPEDGGTARQLYGKMGAALKATGRPIVFSICEWGVRRPWLWGQQAGGQLWRSTGDIWNGWGMGPMSWNLGIDYIGFDLQRGLEAYAGPGHWNDPDMLVVGLTGQSNIAGPGCTLTEQRTHFSLWCLLAAPLMTACDLRSLDAATLAILTNREVIALNQDPLGKQGYAVLRAGKEVWKKPLQNGDLGVGLFNRGIQRITITAHWSDLEISGKYKVRDLWQHADLGEFEGGYSAEVEPHGCTVLRLSPM